MLLLVAVLFGATNLRAQAPAPPSQTYDSFRLVRLRNMFDPDRRGLKGDASAAAPAAARPGGPLPNYITFTGAMVTAGRKLAFFSGARPEYNKVLSPGGKIADFTVLDVTPSQVQLGLGGKPVVVGLGQNVPLAGSSAAKMVGLAPAPDLSAPPAAATAVNTAPPAGAPPGSDDVLRRMMERRQKELAK